MARAQAAGVRRRPALRAAACLIAGVLTVPALAGCGSGEEAGAPLAPQDIAPAARDLVAHGGKVTWAMDALPETFNSFQADADAATTRVAGAVLPSLYTLDAKGHAVRNPDFLEKAEVIEREPKQVVLYQLNQKAVWSDGREIGAADFAAQWRALSGKDSAYWTARNAGYDRIEKVERGKSDLEVRVTFAKPYADWRSLFSPLYPKEVMGTPDTFNDGARDKLKKTAGPFAIEKVNKKKGRITLARNERWWGRPAKLDKLVFQAVPRKKRIAALAEGKVDLAEIGPSEAKRIELARRDKGAKGPLAHGPGADLTPAEALRSWARANTGDEEKDAIAQKAREKQQKAIKKYAKEQRALRGFRVRKSLEPAYTQLALNGADGPLADERVRRAVARAIDRAALAETVLKPLGLPAQPVGSHLALAGQKAYKDNSGALGRQDADEAQALLADAGWVRGGPIEKDGKKEKAAEKDGENGEEKGGGKKKDGEEKAAKKEESSGTYIVGKDGENADGKPGDADQHSAKDSTQGHAKDQAKDRTKDQAKEHVEKNGVHGAYAPKGTAAPKPAAGPYAKKGKALSLRFVLPTGPGSEQLRTVGEKISRMLEKIGIRTEITKVPEDSYFRDHIASGQYDLALYSWPATAFPATDGRPIFAKPQPAADGSLTVEQNYTRVGTDHIDQLFEQAAAELDEEKARDLVRKADARIWAVAGSIPLFQRPQLIAVRSNLVNVGAYGFETPHYEDIGFRKPQRGQPKEPENARKKS